MQSVDNNNDGASELLPVKSDDFIECTNMDISISCLTALIFDYFVNINNFHT